MHSKPVSLEIAGVVVDGLVARLSATRGKADDDEGARES